MRREVSQASSVVSTVNATPHASLDAILRRKLFCGKDLRFFWNG